MCIEENTKIECIVAGPIFKTNIPKAKAFEKEISELMTRNTHTHTPIQKRMIKRTKKKLHIV